MQIISAVYLLLYYGYSKKKKTSWGTTIFQQIGGKHKNIELYLNRLYFDKGLQGFKNG